MTAPWTPRERRMREALEKVKQECLHPLECKVFDPEDGRHAVIWAVEAAEVEAIVNAALSDTPPPDPRDEALKVAETSLKRINKKADIQLSSNTVGDAHALVKIMTECYAALAAIAAAKGEK